MQNVFLLLLLLVTPVSAPAHPWWCGTRAEYSPDYQAARATSSFCWEELVGLAESQRQVSNQQVLMEYQHGLPNQLLVPPYEAPLLPRR